MQLSPRAEVFKHSNKDWYFPTELIKCIPNFAVKAILYISHSGIIYSQLCTIISLFFLLYRDSEQSFQRER